MSVLIIVGYHVTFVIIGNLSKSKMLEFGELPEIRLELILSSLFLNFYLSTPIIIVLMFLKRLQTVKKVYADLKRFEGADEEDFCSFYLKLFETIQLLSQYFGLVIIFVSLRVYIVGMFTSFYIFNMSVRSITRHSTGILMIVLTFTATELIIGLPIIFAACQISNTFSMFCRLSLKFRCKFQSESHPVSCGLFKIEWSFIFTILTAVYNCILILLQFDMTLEELKFHS